MKRLLFTLLILPLLTLSNARPLAAQETQPAPLEAFILQVARLWAAGDAAALADLAPGDGRIHLDVGETSGAVQGRHAAAALRALFAERESLSLRPARVTVAGGRPLRGFGELTWMSRSRGVTVPHSSTVYVGTVWEGNAWRIRELRLLP